MNEGFAKAIAIDYDGCIAINSWPGIGEPNWEAINRAKEEQAKGAKLILWTCREGHKLEEALKASQEWGLSFDAVNDNLPELKEEWGNNPRKIAAAEYWDDRAVRMPTPWISVKDKLPKYIANKVIVLCKNGYVGFGHYEKFKETEEWYNLETQEPFTAWDQEDCESYEVTHWMQLPDPLKEG